MRAIKRGEFDALRGGEPRGRKVIVVWDKAGIDFAFWEKAKARAGLYFVSLEKENIDLGKCGDLPFDRSDPRNAGVSADELVGPGTGGRAFRRVRYTCPVRDEEFSFITTETTLPPGVIALVYKQRPDIEKVFDELKCKLGEKKSWGGGETSKSAHAGFPCPAHDLMILLERHIVSAEASTTSRSGRGKRAAKRRPRPPAETGSPRSSSASPCAL